MKKKKEEENNLIGNYTYEEILEVYELMNDFEGLDLTKEQEEQFLRIYNKKEEEQEKSEDKNQEKSEIKESGDDEKIEEKNLIGNYTYEEILEVYELMENFEGLDLTKDQEDQFLKIYKKNNDKKEDVSQEEKKEENPKDEEKVLTFSNGMTFEDVYEIYELYDKDISSLEDLTEEEKTLFLEKVKSLNN